MSTSKPIVGNWYWIRYLASETPFTWVPAMLMGDHWSSVHFSDADVEEVMVGELIVHKESQAIQWPKGREAGRMGDMTPRGQSHMRIGLDGDNDVYVSVYNAEQEAVACLEFCSGGGGGGKSLKTRAALISAMVAMEEDSIETPDLAFPPVKG